MTETGVRELRTNLSEYLRLVKNGDTIIITEYGQPIGYIVPYTHLANDKLKILGDAGVLAWSGKRLSAMQPIAQAKGKYNIADLVLEGRE
jgi:prevent-host-death family protein